MKNRPYDKYQSSALWKIVEQALIDLEENNDFARTTDRYYLTGYIVKQIEDKKSKYFLNV